MQKTKGKIHYIDLEGGFWGIISEENQKLFPIESLSTDFQKEGLQVNLTYLYSDAFSFQMWGRNIKILSITPI